MDRRKSMNSLGDVQEMGERGNRTVMTPERLFPVMYYLGRLKLPVPASQAGKFGGKIFLLSFQAYSLWIAAISPTTLFLQYLWWSQLESTNKSKLFTLQFVKCINSFLIFHQPMKVHGH